MKVVALVSGGKDSCYAMQRCVDFGHQIIALANLLPLEDTVDELDSFMFQTVGHQMVGAIAQCMGLPLFRRRIQGTARTQELRYRKTEGDEVEDLERLLRAVQEKYPDVRAVCSGAIASNYQRLRVENVCSRLGLVSLAYLWKQDQAHLLQQMIDSGIHAVLVKVAAMGLNPHKHLGQDLATLQPHFTLLARLYGSNICGEGGEYESLTLDSPLFKHARICLDEFQVTLHSPDQFAPVGVLHPTKFHLEEKFSLTPPPSLDSLVVSVTNDTVGEENLSVTVDNLGLTLVGIDSAPFKLHIATVAQRHGVFTFSCWRQGDDSQDLDAGYELGVLLASLEAELQRNGRTWAYVVYVRLFLEDMGHFGRANEVYVQHITELKCERGVPSRCCMQLYLQKGGMGKAMVEVTVAPDLSKKVLHVQSISLWAPSCIGPYSQATLQGQVLHMAGQLGLDPPTMILVAGGVAAEMEQAVLNCEAVAQEFDISLCTCAITFTVYCSENIGADGQRQTEDILQSFLSRNKRCGDSDSSPTDVEKISTIGHPPLVLYVLVPALPKGAQVEIEPSAFVSSSSECFIDRDSIDDMSTRLEETASGWAWQCVQISSGKQEEAYLDDDDDEKQQGRKSLTTLCEGLILPTHFCRAFTFINVGSNDHASGLSHHLMQRNDRMQLDTNEFKTALEQCMEAVGQVLEQAHLSWSEITVFRIYYVAQLIAVADLQNWMKEILASCSRKAHTYDLKEQQPPPELPILEATFIPTGGVGHSAAVNALVAMDFTAMGSSSRSSEHL